MEKIQIEPSLIKNICFSDVSTFLLNGLVNKQNCRYWNNENPHVFREGHTQFPQKLNVWARILGNEIIGPIFIDGNLTAELYLNLLQNKIDPLITQSLQNQVDEESWLDERHLHFQQDGAPPHYALRVRQWLNERFRGKWIGRRETLEEFPRHTGQLIETYFKTSDKNLKTGCSVKTPGTGSFQGFPFLNRWTTLQYYAIETLSRVIILINIHSFK